MADEVARRRDPQGGEVFNARDARPTALLQGTHCQVRFSRSADTGPELCPPFFASGVLSTFDTDEALQSVPCHLPAVCSAVPPPASHTHTLHASHTTHRLTDRPLLASPPATQSSPTLLSAAFAASTVASVAAPVAGPPAPASARAFSFTFSHASHASSRHADQSLFASPHAAQSSAYLPSAAFPASTFASVIADVALDSPTASTDSRRCQHSPTPRARPPQPPCQLCPA